MEPPRNGLRALYRNARSRRLDRFDRRYYRAVDDRQENDLEIEVFGLKRSGNHAIINWILANRGGTDFFLNNIHVDQHINPFVGFGRAIVEVSGTHQEIGPRERRRLTRLRELRRRHAHRSCLLHSYEDTHPNAPWRKRAADNHDLWLGKSRQILTVVIVRDPFNCFASRMQRGMDVGRPAIDLWKTLAASFGRTNDHTMVPVSYNRWFAEPSYREEIAASLRLGGADAGVDEVVGIGRGSSFDATNYDGRASQMQVLNRWQSVAEDHRFHALIADHELIAASRRIFGDIPGTEALLGK